MIINPNDFKGGNMEYQSVEPIQFYSHMNKLIDSFDREQGKTARKDKLKEIYKLLEVHFKEIDPQTEANQINQLKNKLIEADVDKDSKVMILIKDNLNLTESQSPTELKSIKGGDDKELNIDLSKEKWEDILPEDIWKEVLVYLSNDLIKISHLDKKFNQLIKAPIVQAKLIEKYANLLTVDQLIGLPQSSRNLVKSLDLRHKKDLTDLQLQSLITAFPRLQTLELSHCSNITDEGLKLIDRLSDLIKLSLRECTEISDQSLIMLGKMKKLQILDLSSCQNITDKGLKSLEQLKNLITLSLADCILITDEGLQVVENYKKLKTLNLSRCKKITDNGLKPIQKIPELQSLSVLDCKLITDEAFKSMKVKHKLKSISS